MASWDKRENETNKAYVAFRHYLTLGNERTLRKAAQAANVAEQSCERWSSKHDWVDRVRDFETEQTRQFVGSALNMITHNQEQIQTDMLNDTQAMLAWWRQEISRYKENPTVTTEEGEILPTSVDPKQMKLFFEARRIIDDLARRAIGLPAQNPVSNAEQEKKELPPSERKIRFLGIPVREDE
jgi:hypothetical protein